jgi:hypothetical protein
MHYEILLQRLRCAKRLLKGEGMQNQRVNQRIRVLDYFLSLIFAGQGGAVDGEIAGAVCGALPATCGSARK